MESHLKLHQSQERKNEYITLPNRSIRCCYDRISKSLRVQILYRSGSVISNLKQIQLN